jgi:BA14K-like protein
MKKALGAGVACIVLATSSIVTPAVADSHNYRQQERVMGNYCDRHPGDHDCWDWNHHRDHWNESRYHDWYGRHRHDFGPADAAAAVFGFVAGAAAGAISGGMNGATTGSHRAACDARYRSYDWRTDTFMGYDGQRHYCRL